MLGLTTLSKWFRSTSSIGNELEARLKAGEEAIQAEWAALVARVEALEKALHRLGTHTSFEVFAKIGTGFLVLVFGQNLTLFEFGFPWIDNNIILEINDLLKA